MSRLSSSGKGTSHGVEGKIGFFFLLVCLRKKFPSKFIYEEFTNYIYTWEFVYDLFTKFRTLIIYLLYIYEVVKVKRFTKNLLKFVYFVYEPFPKIWSEFVYGWFTASLPNNFDVRLPRFVYQDLVNEQTLIFFFSKCDNNIEQHLLDFFGR